MAKKYSLPMEQLVVNSPNGSPNSAQPHGVDGTSSSFGLNLFGNIIFPAGTKVAVKDWSYNVSMYNISSSIGNNILGFYGPDNPYSVDTPPTQIVLQDGNYSVSDINTVIGMAVGSVDNVPNISISINLVNSHLIVEVNDADGYMLDMGASTIYEYLGYTIDTALIEANEESPQIINLFQVTHLVLHSSLIRGTTSFINGSASDALYTSAINVGPGYFMIEAPAQKTFLPMSMTEVPFNRIDFWVSDQLNRPVDLNGQPMSFTLIFKMLDINGNPD